MKILIIHTYGLGDMVMFTPALKVLREKYPSAKIDFLIFQKSAVNPIKNCKFVNNIYTSSFNFKDLIKTIKILRKNKYNMSIVTSGTNPLKAGLFSFLIGAKERIGEIKNFNPLYTKPVKYIENIHRVENNMLLITNINLKIYPYICGIKKEEKKNIRVGFHIGSNKKYAKKRWEKEKFIELIKKLKSKFPQIEIVIFSGKDEEEESKEVATVTKSKLMLNLDFDTLMKEISKCSIFINTDSGLGHLASCYRDIEVFTIFGPTKDYKIKPYSEKAFPIKLGLECQPCYGTKEFEKCQTLECLRDLSSEFVFDFILKKSRVLKNA